MADRCDSEIYEKGEYVGLIAGANAETIEAFVKCVSKNTGVRMDWHYVGGRARVLALGDVQKAKEGMKLYRMIVDAT